MSMTQSSNSRFKNITILIVAAVFLAFVFGGPSAFALACGDFVFTDTTLTEDLGPCPSNGLWIAASVPLTLDLNGHTITGQGTGDGIVVFGSHIVVKGRGRITNFGVGVSLEWGDQVVVYDLNLDKNRSGVALYHSSGARIFDNTIRGLKGLSTGVFLSDSSALVYRNEIKDFSYGFLNYAGSIVISENVITNNQTGIRLGIDDGSYRVRGNIIQRNQGNGIEADVAANGSCGQIEDNMVKDNGENGILVTGIFGSCLVQDNLVTRNQLNGISVGGGNGHKLLGNRLYGNGVDLNWDGVSDSCGAQNVFDTSSQPQLPQCSSY